MRKLADLSVILGIVGIGLSLLDTAIAYFHGGVSPFERARDIGYAGGGALWVARTLLSVFGVRL